MTDEQKKQAIEEIRELLREQGVEAARAHMERLGLDTDNPTAANMLSHLQAEIDFSRAREAMSAYLKAEPGTTLHREHLTQAVMLLEGVLAYYPVSHLYRSAAGYYARLYGDVDELEW